MLAKAKKEELAKVFKSFDRDGDGYLSKEDLKQGYLEDYGKVLSEEEVELMFRSVDSDQSGQIGFSEFVVAAMNEQELTSNEFLAAAFKMFDKDGLGVISVEDIKQTLGYSNQSQEESKS
jgi:calcium-dependent protein kinase